MVSIAVSVPVEQPVLTIFRYACRLNQAALEALGRPETVGLHTSGKDDYIALTPDPGQPYAFPLSYARNGKTASVKAGWGWTLFFGRTLPVRLQARIVDGFLRAEVQS